MQKILDCIDAGSAYCPCHLAETGECIMCSQLQGRTFCDCANWKGVCIYHDFVSNRYRKREQRESRSCRILKRDEVSEGLVLFGIEVGKEMARELNAPGTYVFMRDQASPAYYDTPMSIMTVEETEGTIIAAVQVRGVKTKALGDLQEKVEIRGPYWNGLLGLKYIKGMRDSAALIIARGVGQAAVLPAARKLIAGGNKVKIILDAGRNSHNFTEAYFQDLGCEVALKPLLSGKALEMPFETASYIKETIIQEQIGLVVSGGSEKLHQKVAGLLLTLEDKPFLACSNDAKFCCGEGICGSCHTRVEDGSRIKTCKTQLNPFSLYERRAQV
ncbi:MAG: sulfide/dihydroorotate dehydrogenase-like FAD/NAD-binding protein [Clostridia bacterium]|nr:sulfide/dihydroorotate dehydrogenase-like FAD/NAD-binding protein [Clostridia bacterium]